MDYMSEEANNLNQEDQTIIKDKVLLKVILLYIAENLDNLTEQELMQIALESMYMDYFTFSRLLTELEEEQLLMASIRKEAADDPHAKPRYSLTGKGMSVLDTLRNSIPVAVTRYLNKVIKNMQAENLEAESVKSEYSITPEGLYKVKLSLSENSSSYFDLEILIPNKEMAIALCKKWKNSATNLYPAILKVLNSSDPEEIAEE